MSIFEKLKKIWNPSEDISGKQETDTRTAIHSQVAQDEEPEIPLSKAEQSIADRFDSLPGKCKRKAQKMRHGGPDSWTSLEEFCTEHEVVGHTHK